MKRTFPMLLAIVLGFVLIVAYFIPAAESWGETVSIWFDILAAIAFVLGGGNLMKVHLRKVSDRAAGWAYSIVCLAAFLTTLFVGLGKFYTHPPVKFPDAGRWSGNYSEIGSPFWWLYEYGFKPLTATMFAMLAFYVASAAFRAFRAKNIEAILLLGTAFVILVGRTAAGPILTGWFPAPIAFLNTENLTADLMNVFNQAGQRAIMIGIALGTASVSLKILLGVDRSYLGSGED